MGNCNMVGSIFLTAMAMCLVFMIGSTEPRTKKPYQPLTMKVDFYILPLLPYNLSDLEPYITEKTIYAHYLGHQVAYQSKTNAVLSEWRKEEPDNKFAKESIFEIIKKLDEVPEKYRTRVGNQGGGFVNHGIYFSCMSPNPANVTRAPTGKLLNDITSTFGSFEAFKEKFTQEAATLFGSGYVWLVRKSFDANAELAIVTTSNQGSPISDGMMPLLVIDVWEHAYYLKHEYRRNKYIEDWWVVADWVNVLQMEGFWLTGKVDHDLREKLKKDEL